MKTRLLRGLLTFIAITAWLLSGWPVIWQNPRIPPKIKEVKAATAPVIEAGDITESGNNTVSSGWELTMPAYETGDLLILNLVSDANVVHEWPAELGQVDIRDVTSSGNNTASTSWNVSRPAYSSGDLIVFNLVSDANVTHDWPDNGPNGETIVTIVDSHSSTSPTAPERVSAFYYIATDSQSAGTLTVTPSASEQWTATTFRVASGSFNASTPIDSSGTGGDSSGTATNVPSPSWSATSNAAGGLIVVWLGVDADRMTARPAGWVTLASIDRGAVAGTLSMRSTLASASETITSANWTIAGDSSSTLGYVIRPSGSVSAENVVTLANSHSATSPTAPERVSAFYFVAKNTRASSSVFLVGQSAPEQWTAAVIKVSAGEFDPDEPIQSTVGTGGSSSGTSGTVPSPSWTSSTADGRIVVWLGVDADPISGTPSGWTNCASTDRGAVSGTISTRDNPNTLNEVIASANWTIAGDSSSTLGYVVNAPPAVVYSVSISPEGTIEYGLIGKGESKSTLQLEPAQTRTATNNGNTTAKFNIKTSNAANGTSWTIGSSAGENVFVLEYSTNGGSDWTKFTAADEYTTLATGVGVNDTVDFDLRITVPTDSDATQKNITITVQAVAP